ncbi:MAG: NlpC/P60 family protein [Fimbriimonadaceae bacterium]
MLRLRCTLGLLASVPGLAFGQDKTYTVREGDTLSAIASRLGVTVRQLSEANRLTNPDSLKPGMVLKVPAVKSARQLPTLLEKIRQSAKLPGARVAKATSQQAQAPLAAKAASPTSGKTYTVKPGDNDWIIAARVGVTPRQLRLANPGIVWNRLQIGTKLALPAGATIPRNPGSVALRSPYAKVAKDSVVVRSGPGSDHRKVVVVPSGTLVKVLDRSNGWYKLRFPLGTVGWVRGDLLKPASKPAVQVATGRRDRSPRAAVASTRVSKRRNQGSIVRPLPEGNGSVLETAFAMRGTRYRYGASSRSAVDCSGFTRLVYERHGVSLPHSSRAQANLGVSVPRSQLQKGDLVFFKTNRGTRINHVGIYIGGGKFIHASSGGGRVQVNSLDEGYYKNRFAGARRVAKNSK